jgi:hypothetical protein
MGLKLVLGIYFAKKKPHQNMRIWWGYFYEYENYK